MENSTKEISEYRLHLACGNIKRDGWINIDKYIDCDLKIDVLDLDKHFKEESIDEIFGNGIFEHLSFKDGEKFLEICYRILKKGGQMILTGIPDLELFCLDFNKYPNKRNQLLEGFYGNQEHDGQFHKSAYTADMINNLAKKYNFKINIKRYAKRVFHLEFIK